MSYLKLWDFYHKVRSGASRSQLRKACQQNFLSYNRMREWVDIHHQLSDLVAEVGLKPTKRQDNFDAIHRALLTGLLTWLIGRPANHIGASGVIYMLTAFLFFKGLLSRQYQLVALAMAVVFLYGSLLWYIFPIDPKISWEGHLSGFAVGLLFALLFRAEKLPKRTYSWEAPDYDPQTDEFMQQFDEDGNFIGDQVHEQETPDNESTDKERTFTIRYEFKRRKGPPSP